MCNSQVKFTNKNLTSAIAVVSQWTEVVKEAIWGKYYFHHYYFSFLEKYDQNMTQILVNFG